MTELTLLAFLTEVIEMMKRVLRTYNYFVWSMFKEYQSNDYKITGKEVKEALTYHTI